MYAGAENDDFYAVILVSASAYAFFLGLLFKEPSGSAQDIPNLQVLRTKLFAFATSRASLSLAFGGDVFPVLAFYLIVLVLYVVFIVK